MRTKKQKAPVVDRVIRNMFGEIPTEWWGKDNARECATNEMNRKGHTMLWEGFCAECMRCGLSARVDPRPSEAHGAGFELFGFASEQVCQGK